jgi:dipeptidyl aminopeptidase/acylaminoacyl peptidase
MKSRLIALLGLALLAAGPLRAQSPAAIGIEEFITTPVVSDPQPAPDGSLVAFTVTTASLGDNRASSRIWVADLATGDTRQFMSGEGNDRAPRWAPDGKSLAFISTRSGSSQLWRVSAKGGAPEQLGTVEHGVADFVWSPDGKNLFFWTDVPWGDSLEAARRAAPYPTEARIFTDLYYRHWNEWRLGVRSHVFRISLQDGAVTDITPFDRDVPPIALGGSDVAVSPFGAEVAVVYNPDSALATSTNNEIYVMGADGSARQRVTNSAGNDHSPQYSPDGRVLGYLSMATPGFEADRTVLTTYDRASGLRTAVTERWDRSIQAFQWLPTADAVIAEVEERGGVALYRIAVPSGRTQKLVSGGVNSGIRITRDGQTVTFLRQTASRAAEVWAASVNGGNLRQVSHVNDARFAGWDLPAAEEFGFVGAREDSVFGWIVRPPGFDPAKRYPLIYLIHGGPQGAWLDQWHSRWNYALFAARGYVVAAVNFHGSTGYGQEFTNSISRNWGGLPYEDLMAGLDVVSRLPYVDSTRMGAAGASYGGYMVYWIAGQTSRFKALVAHDGVFQPLSMSGTTEELWFPHWEFGGSQFDPTARAVMEKWSPANFISRWRTPMLIVHGQNDYRIDVSEGLQAFTALRLKGVPGKFLYFPDEDHFVTRPRNRRLWWGTVLDWLDEYLKGGR